VLMPKLEIICRMRRGIEALAHLAPEIVEEEAKFMCIARPYRRARRRVVSDAPALPRFSLKKKKRKVPGLISGAYIICHRFRVSNVIFVCRVANYLVLAAYTNSDGTQGHCIWPRFRGKKITCDAQNRLSQISKAARGGIAPVPLPSRRLDFGSGVLAC
jgi:hypothetical protein